MKVTVGDLYEKLKGDLHRFARSIARHEQEANDLVQDALLKSLKEEELVNLPSYKQKAWFYRVMKNRLIDERRKEQRLTNWEDEFDFPVQGFTTTHLEMMELLGKLPAELSDLLFKRYWLGHTSQEIGKQLEMPAATVRYKLHLAIKKLRGFLEEEKKWVNELEM